MLDTVRRYMEAGREVLTSKKAEELARALVKEGRARGDQVQQLTRELVDWSKKNAERFRENVTREVQKQVAKAGVATKADLEALKRRLRKLESGDKKSSRAGKTTKSATKRTSRSGGTTTTG